MNALMAREASRHGALAGMRAGLAAPAVDTLYLVLVVFGILQWVDPTPLFPWMAGVGAAVMAWFAWGTVRLRQGGGDEPPPARFRSAVVLSVANPFQLLWWASAGPVLLLEGLPWSAAGFLGAIFSWVAGYSWLVSHGARRWAWFPPAVALLSAHLLLLFALRLLLATGL